MNKEEIKRRLAAGCLLPQMGEIGESSGCPGSDPEVAAVPAAVLVALVGSPQGPEIVLTERTAGLRNHPAQISLPGGRIESGDSSPEAAALRETWEEVSLPPERVELLGCLPRHRTVSDYCIHPFVGWVDPPVSLVPDKREVADVFLVPLKFVMNPANHTRESMWRDGRERTFYVLPFLGRRIWGATAAILVSLARTLDRP